jgi:hypothetical protein
VIVTPWVPSPQQRASNFIERIRSFQQPGSTFPAAPPKQITQSLGEELFDSLSRSARWVSMLSMHLNEEWRQNILEQFKQLLSLDHWDDDSNLLNEGSTRTFLRFIIFGNVEQLPSLGISNRKRLTAAWSWGKDRRLGMELADSDRCRMVFSYPGEFEVVRQAMDGNIGDAAKILAGHGFHLGSEAP